MDFTLESYKRLVNTLSNQGFSFFAFEQFISNSSNKVIVLRHDVDALPVNSLEFAKIQADMGIKGSYYFRIIPESYDEKIIKEIYSLGHEIGYHYEDLGATAQCHKGVKGEEELVEMAIKSFKKNLERLRQHVPVKTICMHGSPMSNWDSRLMWKYYDYHHFGIIGEPYLDVDFDEVLYQTDTGRRWDGDSFNIRDKATEDECRAQGKNYYEDWKVKPIKYRSKDLKEKDSELRVQSLGQSSSDFTDYRLPITNTLAPRSTNRSPFPKFHSTSDITCAAEKGQLPDKIMLTFHPQRWTDKPVPWVKELVWQNVKNLGKYFLVKVNS